MGWETGNTNLSTATRGFKGGHVEMCARDIGGLRIRTFDTCCQDCARGPGDKGDTVGEGCLDGSVGGSGNDFSKVCLEDISSTLLVATVASFLICQQCNSGCWHSRYMCARQLFKLTTWYVRHVVGIALFDKQCRPDVQVPMGYSLNARASQPP